MRRAPCWRCGLKTRLAQLMGHAINKGALPLPGNRKALLKIVESKGDGLQRLGLLGHGNLVPGQGRRLGGGEMICEFLQGLHQTPLQQKAQQATGE